ncbi:MAG TPA: cation:proton antiporter [Gammaproteobacteria bacterium]|nr:cation:proton antiporter [Gammaproteobacteria bacterium]
MHSLAPLIYDLTLMLGIAGIVILVFQRIHQPVVLGYLVAGMILGPYTPPHNLITDEPNIKILSELGVIFLMFSLGLEFSFHKLTRVGLSALVTGIMNVFFMFGVGFIAGRLLGWKMDDILFLGAALSISSTTIIIKAIDELGLKSKRFAEFIFGILIVEDLLAILLLVGLSAAMKKQSWFSMDMLSTAGRLVMVVAAWFTVGYFILPTFFKRIAKYLSQETLTIVAVALCLFLVTMADTLHYSTALGAFIMGSILAETVLVHRIEEIIIPIRDIFGAVFFITVGMLINPYIILEQWQAVLMISALLIVGKVLVIGLVSFLTGQGFNTSVRSAFGMAQIGEFSFIIASLGLTLGVVSDQLYPIIVAVSAITTFTTPYFISLSGGLSDYLEKRLPNKLKFLLDAYTNWVYRLTATSSDTPWVRSIFLRVIINGLIVAFLFTLVDQYFYPKIFYLVERHTQAKILAEILSIVCVIPFIWGMVFSYRRVMIPEHAKGSLKPIQFIVGLLTLAELATLSLVFYHTWATTITFTLIIVLFFIATFRQLEKSYHWFETRLVKNIKGKPLKQLHFNKLAPWDTHFIELTVGNRSELARKKLEEMSIRELYGVNIVAIHRGHQIIFAPEGHEVLYPDDRVIVLGNDTQIELFEKKISPRSIEEDHDVDSQFEQFKLKPILVGEKQISSGNTIREAMHAAKSKALVVGLERGSERILNPNLDTALSLGDVLYVVTQRKLKPAVG